ncbi:TPA: hypothetical protein MCV15_000752 [Klebsiella pneumoniae]|nr:hypothetical protein [Klebsiella pneumoniae]
MSEAAAEVFQDAWPEFFPKGVPPKTAEDAEGEFFRLVRVSPPTAQCFLSTHEEYPNRHKKCKGEALICVFGTSFFSEMRGANDAKAKFPEALGNRLVAKEGANKQVISSQADSLIKISRIWADFFPANTSNQPI